MPLPAGDVLQEIDVSADEEAQGEEKDEATGGC